MFSGKPRSPCDTLSFSRLDVYRSVITTVGSVFFSNLRLSVS
jgi:hypothetical protein